MRDEGPNGPTQSSAKVSTAVDFPIDFPPAGCYEIRNLRRNEDPTMRPIGIDLFAGAAGMSLGFEQAGFDVVAAVETDPIHCAVHEFNFPKAKVLSRSVVGLTGAEIRLRAGLGHR